MDLASAPFKTEGLSREGSLDVVGPNSEDPLFETDDLKEKKKVFTDKEQPQNAMTT